MHSDRDATHRSMRSIRCFDPKIIRNELTRSISFESLREGDTEIEREWEGESDMTQADKPCGALWGVCLTEHSKHCRELSQQCLSAYLRDKCFA